ncbi:E3 ubiquitin-protein ligase BRE1A-like [Sycon ciliatum]|uniref:E3 ubiquitin-protein ligase BRE1A-like n=1 Tax=Sycon ciliatum TaxID=27933 RepID=UPI0031F71E53
MASARVGGLPLKAVVSGATGATGQCLVPQLLKSSDFSEVVVIGRRRLQINSDFGVDQVEEESKGRLQQHVVSSFDDLTAEKGKEYFEGAHVYFCCLGTTKSKAGSAENFRKIDYHLVVKLAEIAKATGVRHTSIVSSTMASASSMFLYLRTKGEADDAVVKMDFTRTSIFRPGALVRYGAGSLTRIASRMFMGLPTETLAQALVQDAILQAAGDGEGKDSKQPALYLVNADIYRLARELTGDTSEAAAAGDATASSSTETQPNDQANSGEVQEQETAEPAKEVVTEAAAAPSEPSAQPEEPAAASESAEAAAEASPAAASPPEGSTSQPAEEATQEEKAEEPADVPGAAEVEEQTETEPEPKAEESSEAPQAAEESQPAETTKSSEPAT